MAARSEISDHSQLSLEDSPSVSKAKQDGELEEEDVLGKSMQDEVGEMLRATVTELETALQVRAERTKAYYFRSNKYLVYY